MSGYVKNTWVDQDVERPKTYEVTNNADGSITLTDSFGLVTELGTPVNADNMNHIENGLTRVSITEYDNTFTYSEDDWVTGIVDGEKQICKSLQNNNTGKALTNSDYWEVLDLGGGGSSYQMFDIVMKDHVLSYAETLGLAQLGTYVYKEAIAGTRYGYPDFYQKLVDEYNAGINVSEYESSNITVVGALTNNDGILSGFTANTNYAYSIMQNYFAPGSNPWTLVIKAKMGSTPTTNVGFSSITSKSLNFYIPANTNNVTIELSSNNSTFDIGSIASTGLQTNTYYWFKVEFTGTAYNYYISTDGTTYTLQGTITSSTPIYQNNSGILLGADYNLGTGGDITIDLNDTYLDINNSRFWNGTNRLTYTQNSNKHRFYDIADKATFDNIFGITGECWYYGIDTTNERIFLPRSTRFRNGTSSDVGGYQAAGLPNITGHVRKSNTLAAEEFFGECVNCDIGGAFSGEFGSQNQVSDASGVQTALTGLNFDASRSSSIYGASNTVEYSSTKLIPYMVVGNVAQHSDIVDVVDITTSENDTLPLFTGIYFDYAPNNVSWVIAGGQVVSGTIYTFAYNELVNELTTPKYNLNVIDVDDMVVGTDYSTYWKVDQTNQTFTCPIRTSERVLVAKKEATDADPTWYNLYSDGWCEQGGFSDITYGQVTPIIINFPKEFIDTDYTPLVTTTQQTAWGTVTAKTTSTMEIRGCTYDGNGYTQPTHWQASGYTAVPDITDYTEPLRMYFKVANAVQNLELLDAGAVLTAVNNVSVKVDNTIHITEAYSNGTSGYNVYSNGYCEQWGEFTSSDMTVTFLKPFIDTNYNINVGYYDYTTPNDGNYTSVQWRDKTTSTVRFQASYGGVLYATTVDWCARGYISI